MFELEFVGVCSMEVLDFSIDVLGCLEELFSMFAMEVLEFCTELYVHASA